MKLLYTSLYTFILMCSILYSWHKLLNKKINFKNYKLYITTIGLVIFSVANCSVTNKFAKIILAALILIVFFKYLFQENFQSTIITPIYQQFIAMLSETIFVLLMTIIFNYDAEMMISTYLGTILINVVVAIISMIFVQFKFVHKLYSLLINLTDKIKTIQLVFFCLITMAFSNVLAMTVYYKIGFKYQLIFNFLMTVSCILIFLYSLKTQNSYNKVSDKYNVAINSLTDYENMMSKYRIANHENKNLLLTIRAMVKNKEKEIPKYIDSIIENKYEDDEKLLFKMSVIPSGGLRATIYSEILKIQNNKIDYFLDIDSNLKTVDLIEMSTNTILDTCKIICVFIDNAIEAVKSLKTKNIRIGLYVENDILSIKVSNNYEGNINVDKIFNEGYTTKGDGHGYGLSLVKKIIDSNSKFQNQVEINNNIFSQILLIKYK